VIGMLRRAAAIIGLVVLLPLALGMATGSVSPKDAGIRALIILGSVIVARRVMGYLRFLEEMPGQ
jgi:hypothetical protein